MIDEASLAGTIALDEIVGAARGAGAKVLLVGDWAQLGGVEAGGAFVLLVRDRGDRVPELTEVRRFVAEWERSASIALRAGNEEAIDAYAEHGRVEGGGREQLLEAVHAAWRDDVAAGKTSLMLAADGMTVAELNRRARAGRAAAGEVAAAGVALAGGGTAGVGDEVVTRHNDRSLSTGRSFVKNGDRFVVTATNDDGTMPCGAARADARSRSRPATSPSTSSSTNGRRRARRPTISTPSPRCTPSAGRPGAATRSESKGEDRIPRQGRGDCRGPGCCFCAPRQLLGSDHGGQLRHAARSTPAHGVVAALGKGTFYVLAGPSPISANLWEVTDKGTVERQLTHNPPGYGISWVSASPAGVVMADAIDGVDALYALAASGPRPLATDFVDPPSGIGLPSTSTPSIGPTGEVAFVTPPIVVRKTADDKFLIWVKPSATAPARIAFGLANPPLGDEVWGAGGQLAVPGNTGIPPLAGQPRAIWIVRPGGGVVELDPHFQVVGDVWWGTNAPALAVDDYTAQSELLYLDGRRESLPHGWLVVAWSPDGTRLLVQRGTTFGTWLPAEPGIVTTIGKVADAAHIYQVVWLASPAPAI